MANGVMSNAGRSLRGTVQSIPGEKRIAIAVLAVMLLAGIAGLVYWGQQQEYAVLYSDLTQKTAGSITAQLDKQGVPYQVAGGGKIVKVPKGQVSRLRLSLAEQGLPSGERAGYSLFDKQEMVGMSKFTQKLNFQRALEGELERTINGLEGVATSRVHLVMPEKALFEKDQKKPSASVTLHLKNTAQPDSASVQGVAHMVASAVEGLGAKQVTIVDQNGEVLHGKQQEEQGIGGGNAREEALAFKRNVESRLEQELTSLVERVVGRNRAEVRVSAEINEQQVRLHEEKYDPFGQVARSEQLRTKTQKQPGQPGGVAGAEANVPGGGGEGEGAGGGETVLREKVTNYEVSKTVRDVTKPGGGVKRLSVAVLVDGKYVQGENGQEQFQPRSEESLNDIQALVTDAAGINQERGDEVTVRSLQMEAAAGARPREAEAARLQDFYLQLVKYGGYALVTLLILWFVVRPLMRYLTSGGEARYPVAAGAGGTEGLEGVIPEEYQGMEEGELPPEVRQRVTEERQRMANQMKASEERQRTEQERRSHVVDMINSDVDAATSVIRQWMREHNEQES
jgi:flagellar M-ring protein FliF